MTSLPNPAPPVDEPEDQEVGSTSAGKAVNVALRSLAKAARAFTLYNAKNEAVRRFLGEYREAMLGLLASHGTLELEVRPFELAVGGEVVYREVDRERSVSFRLFRDGVRHLTLHSTVTWPELLKLLEVLSVRFAGVRQQEDDLVTLLSRAAFTGISFEAVEGLVEREDDPEEKGTETTDWGGGPAAPREHVEPPPDFDAPAGLPGELAAVAYRAVSPADLERLAREEAPSALPMQTLRLVRELLQTELDANDPNYLSGVAGTIAEVRDYLFADRRLDALLALVQLIRTAPASEALERVLAPLSTTEGLQRLLDAVPDEGDPPLDVLTQLFELAPGRFPFLLERLGSETGTHRQAVVGLISDHATKHPGEVVAELRRAGGGAAVDLFRILLETVPAAVAPLARELLEHPEPELRREALALVAKAPRDPQIGPALLRLVISPDETLRLGAVRILGDWHEPRAYLTLVRRLRTEKLGRVEAEALGEALALIQPVQAQAVFAEFLTPKGGLFRRGISTDHDAKPFAAVSGLGRIPGEEAEKLIRDAGTKGDEALKEHCVVVMQRRRRAEKPHG